LIAGKLVKIALDEAHIVQSRFDHASTGTSDRMRVLFHTHDFTGRTNQSRGQHCHVSYARAEIQDALTWADACVAKQSFREVSKTCGLPDQAFVFRGRTA
jgi:hypothetical protein